MSHYLLTTARIVLGSVAAVVLVTNAASVTLMAEADPWINAPQSLVVIAPPRLPDATDMIKRDPFTGGPAEHNSGSTSETPANPYPTPFHAPIAQGPSEPNFSSVPNAGAPSIPGFPGSGGANVPNPGSLLPQNGQQSDRVRIVGTVIGEGRAPVAMISDGQHVDFAHIGDTISGKRIVDILVQGIVFEDGSRVAVSDSDKTSNATSSGTHDTPPVPSGQTNSSDQSQPSGVPAKTDTPPPVPVPTGAGAVNPPGGGPVQTSPYTQVQNGGLPTIVPGNYYGAPPTLAPNQTEAPLPRYVSPNQQVAP